MTRATSPVISALTKATLAQPPTTARAASTPACARHAPNSRTSSQPENRATAPYVSTLSSGPLNPAAAKPLSGHQVSPHSAAENSNTVVARALPAGPPAGAASVETCVISNRGQEGHADGAEEAVRAPRRARRQHLAVVRRQDPPHPMDVEAAQQLAHGHHLLVRVPIQLAVVGRQPMPGHHRAFVMRVVVTEV